MASEVTKDGVVIAPLNISLPAPLLDTRGFNWGTVDAKLSAATAPSHVQAQAGQAPLVAHPALSFRAPADVPASQQTVVATPAQTATLPAQLIEQLALAQTRPPPPKFPLTEFQDSWAGNGFNMIFRPRSFKTVIPEIDPTKLTGPDDNILELNLVTEQVTFGSPIGEIPNRGLGDEPDITLAGFPYLQTIQDRTNPKTGKCDNPTKTDIHFEPGMWLNVPSAKFQNGISSVARMASIPHGTTIHAQGAFPQQSKTEFGGQPGGPKIPDIDTTPFQFGQPQAKVDAFPSMKAENRNTFRKPESLTEFIKQGTITTAIIKNPNIILQNIAKSQEILETIQIDVSTECETLNGGGTANISFLAGKQTPVKTNAVPGPNDNPIAHANFMNATYWIEKVNYSVNIPVMAPNSVARLRPTMPAGSTAPTPEFVVVAPPTGIAKPQTIKIPGTQIQTSQFVNLNFPNPRQKGFLLTWPHVSVSTLIPKDAKVINLSPQK